MLAENCLHGTMVAASNAVSHLASVCPVAREKLLARYVSLIKAGLCWVLNGAPGGGWDIKMDTGCDNPNYHLVMSK